MAKRLNIYIAGPYTADNTEKREQNIRKAREIGRKILELGHHPYVPHTHTGKWEDASDHGYESYMQLHLGFLEKWADALFFVGSSPGADREKAKAEKMGMPVFTSFEEFERFAKDL